jgi:hypothetical protein
LNDLSCPDCGDKRYRDHQFCPGCGRMWTLSSDPSPIEDPSTFYVDHGFDERYPRTPGEPINDYAMRVAKATYQSLAVDNRGYILPDTPHARWQAKRRKRYVVFRTGKGPGLLQTLWEMFPA